MKIGFCMICGRAVKVPDESGLTQIQWDQEATAKCRRARKDKLPEYVRAKHDPVRGHKATSK